VELQSLEYPPWRTVYDVAFDYEAKRVLVRSLEGFDSGSTFLRRFDKRQEYQLLDGDVADCRRSFLSEELPLPELPSTLELAEERSEWGGRAARKWTTSDEFSRVTVWQDADTGVALAVTDEGMDEGEMKPLMTFSFRELSLTKPDAALFELPTGVSHKSCSRFAGGWPWIHLFHVYLTV
jgi:hypothetical protein